MSKKIERFSEKNFGFTFSIILLLINIWVYYNYSSYVIISFVILLALLITTIFFNKFLYYPTLFWYYFGVYLSKILNPIILTILYLITIIPIGFLIRLLGNKDLINENFDNKKNSYWENIKDEEINFKELF